MTLYICRLCNLRLDVQLPLVALLPFSLVTVCLSALLLFAFQPCSLPSGSAGAMACCLSALLLFERILTAFWVSWCLGLLLIACCALFPYKNAASHVHQHVEQRTDQPCSLG